MNCPQCQRPAAGGALFCSVCGAHLPVSAAVSAGKTPVVVWVVGAAAVGFVGIAFIGIIAAIAIPNLLSAIQRGKQKRTMGDLKTVASAVEQYAADIGHYPDAQDMDGLCKVLNPDYLTTCIRHDGWSTAQAPREFRYLGFISDPAICQKDAEACPDSYVLASAGKDGLYELADPREYDQQDTQSFNHDIVIRNGQFIRQPVGKQMNGGAPVADPQSVPYVPPIIPAVACPTALDAAAQLMEAELKKPPANTTPEKIQITSMVLQSSDPERYEFEALVHYSIVDQSFTYRARISREAAAGPDCWSLEIIPPQ